ncbi:MAG: exodeoxyribonuclease VII small subunit [Pseudomonadota bacterium]|nr:exodeoxyribonuclease VII small subunit [Pseudomonadota bacterium]
MEKEIEQLSFEEAMEELEAVVRQLESGKIKLDEAVAVYERGAKLKNFCEQKLTEAKSKIDKLVIGKDGTPIGIEEFNHDDTE